MSNPQKILVIGAGLPGVSVSVQLLYKGVDVVLVDNGIQLVTQVRKNMKQQNLFSED